MFTYEKDERSRKLLVIGKICQDLMKSQYGEYIMGKFAWEIAEVDNYFTKEIFS